MENCEVRKSRNVMKKIYIYSTSGIEQLVKKIVAVFFITAFILSALLPICYSQERMSKSMSKAINGLSRNHKLNRPDAILKKIRKKAKSRTRVIVNLVDPKSGIQAQKLRGHAKPRRNFKKKKIRRQLKKDVLGAQDLVINSKDAGNVRVTNRFSYCFGFSAEVTLQGLQDLVDDPNVLSVDEDMILTAHLNQGIPLMNGSTVRSTYNGSGLSIAICDTGIDYTHPFMGYGGFPNSKVIGGYDTGQNDSDPMDGNGHGTSVAGIAAGDLPPAVMGDYIGGVAYNAKLYALKISSDATGDSAFGSAMTEAWEWCIAHQYDDPENPIMIINMSFGGEGEDNQSSCDAVSASMTTVAANVKAAGMTLFISSGNDGLCDSISWPGCLSDVISVGAVYDADIGTVGNCVDDSSCASNAASNCPSGEFRAIDNTAADMVTSYSNTASFLTLFAPSHNAYTLNRIIGTNLFREDFGGTSAASPYAAGAGAAVQSAAKALTGFYLTPTELESYLTSNGDSVTDSKSGITKPRVNLGNSIAVLDEKCSSPDVAIPDGSSSISDSLNISTSGVITDLNISVDVTHSFVGNLKFTLTHEDTGTSVIIIDRPGMPPGSNGCQYSDIDVTLDDEAASSVEDACSPVPPAINGSFIPNNPLSAFDSENLYGMWTLEVSDNASGNTGTLNSWCLEATVLLVWVDFGYLGVESGTQSEPYNTLAEAITAVSVGGEIRIKGSTTSETFKGINSVDKKVTIKAVPGTGTVTIGQ